MISAGAIIGCFFAKFIIGRGRWRAAILVNIMLMIAGGMSLVKNLVLLVIARFIQGFFGIGVG